MGNLCIWSYTENDYELFEKKRCIKCQDTFIPTHGGFSKRKSCRYHCYRDGECIDCREKENKRGYNCYHQAYH